MKNELYESKREELNSIINEESAENFIESLSDEQRGLLETVDDVLSSPSLILSDPESNSAIALANGVNHTVFESVAIASYGILESIVNEKEEEEEEVENGTEEKEDSEEEKTPEKDFEDEKEKEATQEALIDLIYATEYVITTDVSDKSGLVINENSDYFSFIKESLIERLIETCEGEDEIEVCEEILSDYNGELQEQSGVYTVEVDSKDSQVTTSQSDVPETVKKKNLKQWIKDNPKKAIAIGIPTATLAGFGIYKGGKALSKKLKKNKGKAIVSPNYIRHMMGEGFKDSVIAVKDKALSSGKGVFNKASDYTGRFGEFLSKKGGTGLVGKAGKFISGNKGVITGVGAGLGAAGAVLGALKLRKHLKKKKAEKLAKQQAQAQQQMGNTSTAY